MQMTIKRVITVLWKGSIYIFYVIIYTTHILICEHINEFIDFLWAQNTGLSVSWTFSWFFVALLLAGYLYIVFSLQNIIVK